MSKPHFNMTSRCERSWVDRHVKFEDIDNDTASLLLDASNKVRIISWNFLANQYIRYQQNVSHEVLVEHNRIPLWRHILQRFESQNVDFICLQEVDVKVALQTLKGSCTRLLTPTGHGHGDTRVDACCIFFRTNKWSLVDTKTVDMDELATLQSMKQKSVDHDPCFETLQKSFLRNNYGLLAKFKNRFNGQQLVVANTHLYWNPEYDYVKLCQAHYLLLQLHKFVGQDDNAPPVILCGDLNSQPGSVVHTYLTKGTVNAKSTLSHDFAGSLQVQEWLQDESLACPLNLKSLYTDSEG